MNSIKELITEKLKIDKNTKSKNINIDPENTDLMTAIIKSVFMSIYKNDTFRLKGLSRYIVKRSEINWDDVVTILYNVYGFCINYADASEKNGKLQSLIRPKLGKIENLINMKTELFKFSSDTTPTQDNCILLKGRDIYFNEWTKYRDKIRKGAVV